ncbi:hypothetical protein AALP_AA6G104900 [Arabis alpina]|uniref:Uncharacterized protein n=1 Tax=Arabis alpina TaxID=50452 RepID=A0A087GND2_ARAAL|nr:hypothetical protein AALP_AA6G104900 [Arabis alpina]
MVSSIEPWTLSRAVSSGSPSRYFETTARAQARPPPPPEPPDSPDLIHPSLRSHIPLNLHHHLAKTTTLLDLNGTRSRSVMTGAVFTVVTGDNLSWLRLKSCFSQSPSLTLSTHQQYARGGSTSVVVGDEVRAGGGF